MQNAFEKIGEFPAFSAMNPEAAAEALPRLLEKSKAEFTAFEQKVEPSWESVYGDGEAALRPFFDAWRLVEHLCSVSNSPQWREVERRFQPEATAFALRVSQSERVYRALEGLLDAIPAADAVRRRVVGEDLRARRDSGMGLSGEARSRFNEIGVELARLATEFHDNVIDATAAFSKTVPAVDGLPANIAAGSACEGGFRLTIDDAFYPAAMKHLKDRSLREALYRARVSRAPANTRLVPRIIALKSEKARLLGYSTAAELSLASKCAPSVAAVNAMIAELRAAALPVAERERKELEKFAGGPFEPWDEAFFAERRREKEFSYSEEELSRYFDLPDVLAGLFALARRLFGVVVAERPGAVETWHPDVRFFEVADEKSSRVIAHFYFDPFVRPGAKSGGAWMNEIGAIRRGRLPLALISCNFQRPGADGRCLLPFREVETLFHEFGHALQHMLCDTSVPEAAGLSLIEWDAVELASQFMENWCYDRATVRAMAFSGPDRTPIPDALFDKVLAARNYRSGSATLRQLAFAEIDMTLFSGATQKPDEVKRRVFGASGIPMLPEDRFLESFTHIFAGGYCAGYYSYKWSEIMSADAFAAFEEAGLGDDEAVRRIGKRYRETVLGIAGSLPADEVFRRFRGRDARLEALMRHSGFSGKGANAG